MKQFFIKLRSDKPFRCSVGILLCTLVSGILNPVYRILEPSMMDSHMEFVVPFVHIGMVICCLCFFAPALNAVKCSYRGDNDAFFQKCMSSIIVIAIISSIVAVFIGLLLITLTIFLFFGVGLLVMIPFLAVCGINGILGKKALEHTQNS